jgi:uncharacterized membrane protein YbaN (DUF454 family)
MADQDGWVAGQDRRVADPDRPVTGHDRWEADQDRREADPDGSGPTDPIHRLAEAALQAEYETGEHETTATAARAHVALRLVRMTIGFCLLGVGALGLVLPVIPGWLALAAGLALLSRDLAWADRLLRHVRRRMPGIPEHGSIPRLSVVVVVVVALAAGAGVWWITQ